MLFAAGHCFRSLPSQLTHKHTNKPLQDGRAGSASRLDSNLFEEGWEGRVWTKRRNDIVSLTLKDCLGHLFIYLLLLLLLLSPSSSFFIQFGLTLIARADIDKGAAAALSHI